MKTVSQALFSFLLCAGLLPISASASSVLYEEIRDFGSDPGQIAPSIAPGGITPTLTPDTVVVSMNGITDSRLRFRDAFDFSAILPATVDRFEFVLEFANAGPAQFETWGFVIDGSVIDPANPLNTRRYQGNASLLDDAQSPQLFTFEPDIDGTGIFGDSDAFAHSAATGEFRYWFYASGVNSFNLDSATLRVIGTPAAPIPLPAAGWMLLAGCGLLAVQSGRKTARQLH